MTDQFSLFHRLQTFIQRETEAQRALLLRQWGKPIAERISQGKAIEGLTVKEIGKDGIVRLNCETNESRFREGDILVLHHGDPQGLDAIQVLVERDNETELDVSLQRGNPLAFQNPQGGWIADEGMLNLSPFYQEALDEVADSIRGREIILPLLDGSRQSMLDFSRSERAQTEAMEKGLDDSQSLAVAQAYGNDLYHLIQGPPGTGKTTVLGHLASMFVREGQRVLLTGLTHRAINHALNKIREIDPDLSVCKIGVESRGSDLLVPNYLNFQASGFADIPGGYAVGATPFATRGGRLSHVDFDTVIFDEASQITLPLAIMGMLAGTKYVFIGDEHQLPPILISHTIQREHASIFGYLQGRGNQTMLTTTYRMNNVLTAWPSKTFYGGQIESSSEVAERRLKLNDKTTEWDHVLEPENPLVFIDTGQLNSTSRSQKEAELVCEIIESLIARGVTPRDIGVVVPYRAQSRTIRNLLKRILSDIQFHEIIIDTVERMQGQEREVVLLSLTTSSPRFAADLADFFFQPERLNVSITRPRTKLIITGSRHLLNAQPSDPQHQEWVELFRNLLSDCTIIML